MKRVLLELNRSRRMVRKNSGGMATYAKLAAARALGSRCCCSAGLQFPEAPAVATVEEAASVAGSCARARSAPRV